MWLFVCERGRDAVPSHLLESQTAAGATGTGWMLSGEHDMLEGRSEEEVGVGGGDEHEVVESPEDDQGGVSPEHGHRRRGQRLHAKGGQWDSGTVVGMLGA